MALHLLHLPPLPPPFIMEAPQGVYKWPWKTAAECPPARPPATSPVSTFPADLGERKAVGPRLGVGIHVTVIPRTYPGLGDFFSSCSSCPAQSGHSSAPEILVLLLSVTPRISSLENLHLQRSRQPPCSLTASLFPQSSMAWCYCVKCVGTLLPVSTMVCMPVRAAR